MRLCATFQSDPIDIAKSLRQRPPAVNGIKFKGDSHEESEDGVSMDFLFDAVGHTIYDVISTINSNLSLHLGLPFEAGDGAEVGTIAAVDVLVELQKGRSLFEVDHHLLLLLTVTVVSDRRIGPASPALPVHQRDTLIF